ncbi:MAG: serine/threonine-protein kinase [Acidobacteriia bacterium]|nr:serine/threonine-protein kinase [Terriglobia bacterium]
MTLASGTKLGPYEIQSPLGAGGMGEVYQAHDTRLERTVAIKVLPSNLSADPNLRQRLEREAKAVSKLSHPHICTLHDIGHQDGVDFLVMEFIEGETLEQRLLKGPLPTDQTIRYGAQIADALAKAHKLGITHRDLKPSNIMLTKSGAKLMDFGLAKQSGPSPLASALTEMTIEHAKLTSEGMLVGTFQYMAPEQLEGKEADSRTDIFAFGEALYEMATGKPAFSGKSRASLIASILTTDPPPMAQLQPLTPPALERVVKKCLAKDPEERWQSASDLASELQWMAAGGSQAGAFPPLVSKPRHRERVVWALATLGLCAAAVVATVYVRPSTRPAGVIRSSIPSEEGATPIWTGDFAGPAVLAPDGSALAYVAAREQGAPVLWVRKLNALHGSALAGTDGAIFPFWSTDSRSLGFFAGGKLKTVSVDGGTPSDVCDAPGGRGGTWNVQGTIVFAPAFQSGLVQVPASGGVPKPVTVLDTSKHDSHRWPYFLPDGKHFLYLALTHNRPRDPADGIYFASLDGRQNRLLVPGYTNAAYAAGRLLFLRDSALMAQSMDPETGELRGQAERVAEDVLVDGTIWRAGFDASGSGLLAYAAGGQIPAQAAWYDRSGKELGTAGEKVFNLNSVRLSPDSTRLATEAGDANSDIWINELKRQVNTRLTFGSGASSTPVWSPDGRWVAYVGTRGKNNIYRKASNGMGQEELLLEGDNLNRAPSDWSPDGKFLLFGIGDFASSGQIWVLPLEGDRKPISLVPGNFVAANARFSPDGHWVAYNSTESGRPEVYVMPFGSGAGKWQVSGSGGVLPVWRHDGKELFYWSLDNNLVSVPIQLKKDAVEVGAPHPMFRLRNPLGNVGLISPYDATGDGQRFVVIETPQIASKPITLVTSWTAELKQK